MSVRIRLARGGTKKRPVYRIVATNSRSPRDGRFLEKLGIYDPLLPSDDRGRGWCCTRSASATGSTTAPSRAIGSPASSTAPGSPRTPCAMRGTGKRAQEIEAKKAAAAAAGASA